MFLIFKRKKIAFALGIISVICALGISIGTNYTHYDDSAVVTNSNIDDSPQMGDAILVSASVDKIENIKNEREIVRSKTCQLLNESIDNPNVSAESKNEAEQKILNIADNIDKELECESLLSLKGYEDSVVFISDNVITVSVEYDNLDSEDVAKIKDVIFGQTGNNNIKIVEVK